MSLSRRQLISIPPAVLLGQLADGLLSPAAAQPALPPPGKTYRLISPPQPTEAKPGQIEVVEFFWLGCPHCYAFEPVLEDWLRHKPVDVEFRRIHVPFQERKHQQLYYTLVAMDRADAFIPKVFKALQVDRLRLASDKEIFDWAEGQGLDRKQFAETFKSFGVRTMMTKATREMTDWGVDGVPMVGVAGKYLTAPSLAGSSKATLDLVGVMLANERVAARKG